MRDIRGIIFDMDGLLINSEAVAYHSYLTAATTFGFQFNGRVQANLAGKTESAIIEEMKRIWGAERDVIGWRTFINAEKKRRYRELNYCVGLMPGAQELLAYLQEHEIPFALASSSIRPHIEELLEPLGVLEAFKVIVDGSEVAHGKPDPEIFLKAATQLGLDPHELAVLEDSCAGVTAARAGGFTSVLIHDDLERLGVITQGAPILVELPDPFEVASAFSDVQLESLHDVVETLWPERG